MQRHVVCAYTSLLVDLWKISVLITVLPGVGNICWSASGMLSGDVGEGLNRVPPVVSFRLAIVN